MRPQRERVVEHYATESVRVTAILRLPLIGLIVLLGPVKEIRHWLPGVYAGVLATYALVAAVWAFFVLRRPVKSWAGYMSTVVDVVAILALCLTSGGATSLLLPVFFLLPISVAFQHRPVLTAGLGTLTAFGYLTVWIFYSKHDDTMGLPNEVYLNFGFLLWLAAATTALCFVLVRRSTSVIALLDVRKRLVSESMDADERNRRDIAEQLHDGPLQNLLAARLDLDELRDRYPDPAFDAVDKALKDTAVQLRSTVSALHPQVLAQLGIAEALRELADQTAARSGLTIDAELEELGRPECQSLLYRTARELLTNAVKHAHASTVRLRLARDDEVITLTVADDGDGFDPAIVQQRIAEGHIGLASVFVRVEALGGSVALSSGTHGTTITVSAPDPVRD